MTLQATTEAAAPPATRTRPLRRIWIAAVTVAVLYLLAGRALQAGAGLVRTVVAVVPAPHELDVRRTHTIDLAGVNAKPNGVAVTANWHGAWLVPSSGLYDLVLESRGHASWRIDGLLANETTPGVADARTRTVWLVRGFHRIDITYAVDLTAPRIVVRAGRTGEELDTLEPGALRPAIPAHPQLLVAARLAQSILGWLALAAFTWAIRRTVAMHRHRSDAVEPSGRLVLLGRALAWIALACILVHGALLRIDAITGRYGTVTSPRWLAEVQTRTVAAPEDIRPGSIRWSLEPLYPHRDVPATRYRSDPYIYLESARKMRSFYAAHFREPVFPFATRAFLALLHNQDVAVSFASALFSVLAIWFTYVLGAAIWSRPVGLLAALGLSLDHDVIGLASLGWRDDAYVAAVALCAYLLVRCWKAGHAPVHMRHVGRVAIDRLYVEAAVLGVASGFAILTRIMAVPLLAAGGLFLLCGLPTGWRRRLATLAIAVATTCVVAGPYFVNCWRVFGDPLYTFNVHGSIYSVSEGKEQWRQSTAAYVVEKFKSRPIDMIDTVAQGLTTYPFTNKWHGLDPWRPGIGEWASTAALAGLVALAAFSSGRLLLMAIVASMVPFSFTWTVDPDFRFTEHVYPALLIAAAVGAECAVRAGLGLLLSRPRRAKPSLEWRVSWMWWGSVVAAGVAALWFVTRVTPSWVFPEMLRARESATITAGKRDTAFFGEGWSEVIHGSNVNVRVATTDASVSFKLPKVSDYPVTLRMDPFPRPLESAPQRLPVVDASLNGSPVAVVQLRWTPERVGSYDFVLPKAAVREGNNRLVLRVRTSAAAAPPHGQPGLSDGDAVAVWYVRVYPGVD